MRAYTVTVIRLSSVDAVFWFVDTRRCPMNVASLRIWNPSEAPNFCFDAVRDFVAARLPALPALRYRVAGARFGLDRPWFIEDATLDLNFHIRRITVPFPGERDELEELIGRLMSNPLDRTRPLWELWFIEGVEQGRVATLMKYHHALVDGVAGIQLADIMYGASLEPLPPTVEASQSSERRSIPPVWRRMLGAILNVAAVTPYRVLRVIQQTLVQQLAVRGLVNRPPHLFQAPITRFNGAISAQRRVSHSRLRLDRMMAIKRAFGVKLNDVVLAVVSGALRSYLEERGELPQRPIVAQMPISTGDDSRTLGNHVTSMNIQLATDVTDPAARLRTIFGNTQGAKEMSAKLAAHQTAALTETVPPGLLGLGVRAYTASHLGHHVAPFNMAVSNVHGSDSPHYLAGAVIEQVVPFGPLMPDVGLMVSCFNNQGWFNFGFVTTQEMAGDIDQLADAMEPALRELEEAAGLI